MTTFGTIIMALWLCGVWVFSSTSFAATSGFTLTPAAICVAGTGCGTVSPSVASCKRNCLVTVQATPFADWRFDHWEGGATGAKI